MALPARGALPTRYKRNPQPPLIVYPSGTLYFERAGLPEDSTSGEKIITVQTTTGPQTITTSDDIVSLPANCVEGQVSVTVKGRSLKNELNYNRETWAEWTTNAIGNSDGLEFTGDGIKYPTAQINTSISASKKYGLLLNIVVNTLSTIFKIGTNLTGSNESIASAGAVGYKKLVFTTKTELTSNIFKLEMSIPDAGTKLKVTDIRLFELPAGSEIESDFTNLTADQLAQKYPYINGDSVKSTVSALRLVSVGKNLINKEWFITDRFINKETGSFIESGAVGYAATEKYIQILSNTNYVLDATVGGASPGYALYDANKTYITGGKPGAFTTPSNAKYIRVSVDNTDTAKNTAMLRYSTTDLDYEPHKISTAYINAGGELRSVSSVKDEISVSDGKLIKRVRKVILDGNIEWGHASSREGYHIVVAKNIKNPFTNHSVQISTLTKYDGNFLQFIGSLSSDIIAKDQYLFRNDVGVYISVDNAESGWADTPPSTPQIEDYFASKPYTLTYQLASQQVIQLEPVIREQRVLPSRRLA